MDQVAIQKDLFIGVPEINAITGFQEKYTQDILKGMVSNYGIYKLDSDTAFNNLKVIAGSNLNTITIQAGKAITSDYKTINVDSDLTDIYTIPSDNNTRYVLISSIVSLFAKGYISISSTGQITGVGTEFTNIFRVGDYPTSISIYGSANTGQYEIASVTSDTVAQLTGTGFVAETGKNFICLGTFTQGEVIAFKRLYIYDRYTIEYDTTFNPIAQNKFCLAAIKFNGVTRTIIDMRTDLLTLNIRSVYDFLESANNLADVANVAAARTNLNIYSKLEAVAFSDVINSLNSSLTNYPLSALMGKYLYDNKVNISDIVNNVVTSTTNVPLSAAMGKYLFDNKVNNTQIINDLTTGGATNVLSAEQGLTLKSLITTSATASATVIVDNLTTSSSTQALSANMGKYLFDNKTVVQDNLTTSSSTQALSANQGRILSTTKINISDIVNDVTTGGVTKVLSAEQGKILANAIVSGGTIIQDNLVSTSPTQALSANQGVVLKGLVDSKVNTADVINSLTSILTTVPLSAYQGKLLNDNKLGNTLSDINAVLTGDNNSHSHQWTNVTSKPTTIATSGITDYHNVVPDVATSVNGTNGNIKQYTVPFTCASLGNYVDITTLPSFSTFFGVVLSWHDSLNNNYHDKYENKVEYLTWKWNPVVGGIRITTLNADANYNAGQIVFFYKT